MKKIFLAFLIATTGFAQTELSEVDILTNRYNLAVERSTKSLTDTYKEELKKLLTKYSEKGDIKEVEKITTRLKSFEVVKIEEPKKETLLTNSEWKTQYGSTLLFKKEGAGVKINKEGIETNFMWRVLPDGIVEFAGRLNPESPILVEYIKVDNTQDAFIGKTPSTIVNKLIRIK